MWSDDVGRTNAVADRVEKTLGASRLKRWPKAWRVLAGLVGLLTLAALLWDWDWFKPLVEHQASAALGRPVTIAHLRVAVGLHPSLIVEGIEAQNPDGFRGGGRFAAIDRLAVQIDPWPALHHQISLPLIEVSGVEAELAAPLQGEPNWQLPRSESGPAAKPWQVDIGELRIGDGQVHVVDPKLKSDFRLTIATRPDSDARSSDIRVEANGTYAGQPITAHFVGGSLMTLRDPRDPYPLQLDLANGATRLHLKGTLVDPLRFGGADLMLEFEGRDLSSLYALTRVPLPETPPFHLIGRLDYADRAFHFTDFSGTVGGSDLSGSLAVDPHGTRKRITGDLHSKKVLLADLAGFIGGSPGKADAPEVGARRNANGRLLPDKEINLPKLRGNDFDLNYAAARIESGSTPLDDLSAHLIIDDGQLHLAPLKFGVGGGAIVLDLALNGNDDPATVKADIDFRRLDFGHIVERTSVFKGAGKVGGQAQIDTAGNSLAQMLGNGNGGLKLFMAGGNLSALLVDLAGLDFGNGVLSALGIPGQAKLRCMVADLGLNAGLVDTRMLLFDTTEANIIGTGKVNLKDETVDYRLRTEPKHFSIGSLPAPIDIDGPLKSPRILPDPAALGTRGAAAVLLGLFATPLAALLPTIQLGLGDDNDCQALLRKVQAASEASPPSRPRADRGGLRGQRATAILESGPTK